MRLTITTKGDENIAIDTPSLCNPPEAFGVDDR